MSIKERLQRYCKEKHTTIGTFSRHAGISSSYFNNVKSDIGKDIQTRIANTYDDLNIEWLRTGEGEMLNPPPVKPAIMEPYPANQVDDIAGRYDIEDAAVISERSRMQDVRPLTPDDCRGCLEKIPYVRSEFVQAREVNIQELVKKEPHRIEFRSMRDFIGFPDYAQKVITEAMVPDFLPGDVLFIQYLSDNAKVMSGAIYLVDTTLYGAMVRQVFVEQDHYILHSKNPDYKELKIRKNEVYSFALVLHSLRSNFRISSDTPNGAILYKKREEQMERLLDMNAEAMAEIRLQNERMAEERRRQDEERKAQFEQMVAERNRQDKLIEKIMNS